MSIAKYKKIAFASAGVLLSAFAQSCATNTAAAAPAANTDTAKQASHLDARPVCDSNRKNIIYQILLPVYTHEGTLDKARQMLPHIKDSGFNVVYLCPIVEHDDGADRAFWSKRQKASNTNNPKNPYRLKDYFKIEPDYGTDTDLKNFVDDAHKLGMKVMLDLVYYHCGPNASIIGKDKNLVVLDKNGNVKTGAWSFPELNFSNPKLRELLFENMEYFVKKFGIDGYRTDAEQYVPADFWIEAYKRVSKIKPDIFMLAESDRADAAVYAYDAHYGFGWHQTLAKVLEGKLPASAIRRQWEKDLAKDAKGTLLIRDMDNHDTSSDYCARVGKRYEQIFSNAGMDLVQVINYTIDGIPMVFCGNEFADDAYLSMFSSPKFGKMELAWENLNTAKGKARMALMKKLSELRMSNKALWKGKTAWLDNSAPDAVVSFVRTCDGEQIAVVANATNKAVEASVEIGTGSAMLSRGAKLSADGGKTRVKLAPYAYAVVKLK